MPNPEEGHSILQAEEFVSPSQQHSAPVGHTKRRQYASGQTQAYYGAPEPPAQYADAGVAPGGQLFTPGLAPDGQPPYFAPPDISQGYPHVQPPYGQQHTLQPPYAGGQPVGQLTDQFSQMGIHGQKPVRFLVFILILVHVSYNAPQFSLVTTNLIGMLADPRELSRPLPEIRLPPNTCISPNPLANADPSYMRSTLNAVPATSAILSKSKLPFALVLTPHRSLKEGDVSSMVGSYAYIRETDIIPGLYSCCF